MPRHRICIINAFYPPIIPGGAEISVAELAQEIAKENDVLVISCNTTNKAVDEVVDGVRVIRIPAMNIGHQEHYPKHIIGKIIWRIFRRMPFLRAYHIKKAIKAFDPEIVHMNNLQFLTFYLAPWLKKRGIKTIHTARDFVPICKHMMVQGNAHCPGQCLCCKITNFNIRRAFQKLDANVGISQAIAEQFLKANYYHPERTRIIYNSVSDMGAVLPPAPDSYDVGFIGAMTESKGVSLFLRLAQALPQYRFCIATQSNSRQIDRYRPALPANVIILGKLKPQDFFSQVKVCAVPSFWQEPFGRVAAEALSASRPVLVSNRGGLPEIVRDKIDGYVLDPEAIDKWVEAIQHLLSDQQHYNTIATAARERYLNCFTRDQVRTNYSDLYKHLLS